MTTTIILLEKAVTQRYAIKQPHDTRYDQTCRFCLSKIYENAECTLHIITYQQCDMTVLQFRQFLFEIVLQYVFINFVSDNPIVKIA